MRAVTIELGLLPFEALVGEDEPDAGQVPVRMVHAVRFYLSDRDAARPGWRYPGFLRGREARAEAKLELSVDDELWGEFEAEADRQGVSVPQLAEHAALYFAAELDAGRIAERILDDLEQSGE
jgi:hypothetical protein